MSFIGMFLYVSQWKPMVSPQSYLLKFKKKKKGLPKCCFMHLQECKVACCWPVATACCLSHCSSVLPTQLFSPQQTTFPESWPCLSLSIPANLLTSSPDTGPSVTMLWSHWPNNRLTDVPLSLLLCPLPAIMSSDLHLSTSSPTLRSRHKAYLPKILPR